MIGGAGGLLVIAVVVVALVRRQQSRWRKSFNSSMESVSMSSLEDASSSSSNSPGTSPFSKKRPSEDAGAGTTNHRLSITNDGYVSTTNLDALEKGGETQMRESDGFVINRSNSNEITGYENRGYGGLMFNPRQLTSTGEEEEEYINFSSRLDGDQMEVGMDEANRGAAQVEEKKQYYSFVTHAKIQEGVPDVANVYGIPSATKRSSIPRRPSDSLSSKQPLPPPAHNDSSSVAASNQSAPPVYDRIPTMAASTEDEFAQNGYYSRANLCLPATDIAHNVYDYISTPPASKRKFDEDPAEINIYATIGECSPAVTPHLTRAKGPDEINSGNVKLQKLKHMTSRQKTNRRASASQLESRRASAYDTISPSNQQNPQTNGHGEEQTDKHTAADQTNQHPEDTENNYHKLDFRKQAPTKNTNKNEAKEMRNATVGDKRVRSESRKQLLRENSVTLTEGVANL